MNILVVIDNRPEAGGGFSYAVSMCELLKNMDGPFTFIFAARSETMVCSLENNYISIIIDNYAAKKPTWYKRLKRKISLFVNEDFSKRHIDKSAIDTVVERYSIDLVYIIGLPAIALELTKVPFIATVWDFCHRDLPEFPEVNTHRNFELREHLYNNSLPRAVAVVVDSEALAEKAIKYYNINKERIVIVPFFLTHSVNDKTRSADIVKKYELKKPFLFYPAQFWPHKNHYYLLEGIKILNDEYGIPVDAVFTGADMGNLSYILDSARNMGIMSQIKYLGFISKEDVLALYHEAAALVMPTCFGPTNIPPLEAIAAGCPVLYSDLPEFRKEFDGAAFFMDLNDPRSMAKSVIAVLKKDILVDLHKEAGKRLLENHSIAIASKSLFNIFLSYLELSKRWKDGKK